MKMTKRLASASVISLATLLLLAACGKTQVNDVLGAWRTHPANDQIVWNAEFFDDGTCYISEADGRTSGSWKLLQDGRVKLDFSALSGNRTLLATVEGDEMTIDDGKQTVNWLRKDSKRDRGTAAYLDGALLEWEKKHDEALAKYTEAAELGDREGCNAAAWLLATSPASSEEDSKKAIRYTACALAGERRRWEFVATLAAAYARVGRFDEAISTQTEAIESFSSSTVASSEALDRLRELEGRLALYQAQKPYLRQESNGTK